MVCCVINIRGEAEGRLHKECVFHFGGGGDRVECSDPRQKVEDTKIWLRVLGDGVCEYVLVL